MTQPPDGPYRIAGSHFIAAVVVEAGRVVRAAPILDWVLARRDRSLSWLLGYAKQRGWEVAHLRADDVTVHADVIVPARKPRSATAR